MLIAQITDTHIKLPGKLAYGKVDTAAMLEKCVEALLRLVPQPDLILLTGDLVDLGLAGEYQHLKSLLAPLRQRILAIPGNHDERAAMRAAFSDGNYLPSEGFLQFAIDDEYPLRIIGLDTLVPFQGGGELCAERLAWLEATLQRKPATPTLVLMHHPPFVTGIGHMDSIGLNANSRAAFAAIMQRHAQVELVLCGHLHRGIHARVGGRPVLTCPSPAHQVVLDIDAAASSQFCMEPPGFMLHWWNDQQLISHTASIGDYDGPYPFFDPGGKLID